MPLSGAIAGACIAASLGLFIGGVLGYRYRMCRSFEGKESVLSDKLKAQVKKLSVYQSIATTPQDFSRKGLFEKIQSQIISLEHPDFMQDGYRDFGYVFYDPEADLLARVFKSNSVIVIAFRGSEQYQDRFKRYFPGHFKAIEWSEVIYDLFGERYHYKVIGHCTGGAHAMLAGFQLYHLSNTRVSVNVVGFNSSIPRFHDFLLVTKGKKKLKKFLRNNVTVYQNANDPVYSSVGVDVPILGLWSWNNVEGSVFSSIKSYVCFLPISDKSNVGDTEKKNFFNDFSLLHRFISEETWQHSAIKWMHYLLSLGRYNKVKYLNFFNK